jgi:hypothetical protein
MSKNLFPYIGVSGISDPVSARFLADFYRDRHTPFGHGIHIGVFTSYEEIMTGLTPEEYLAAWPGLTNLSSCFAEGAFNVLHYVDGACKSELDHLIHAILCSGDCLDAIQLDMRWPSPKLIGVVKERADKLVILQLGARALQEKFGSEIHWCEVGRYLNVNYSHADYISIDFSGGMGIELDVKATHDALDALHNTCSSRFMFVTPGGLHAGNVKEKIGPLLRDYPNLSWDAESKLRLSGSNADELDRGLACDYLDASFDLLREVEIAKI